VGPWAGLFVLRQLIGFQKPEEVLYILSQENLSKYNKTDNKIHFVFGTNSYLFRHQGAILREFASVFDLRSFVVDKLLEDDTLVPKHVAVGTRYEVYFLSVLLYFNLCVLF